MAGFFVPIIFVKSGGTKFRPGMKRKKDGTVGSNIHVSRVLIKNAAQGDVLY